MKKLSDLEKIVLKYHNVTYIADAYKIFYGEYPSFYVNDENLTRDKMQFLMIILSEYKIENINYEKDMKYNGIENIPFSDTFDFQCNLLSKKLRNIDDADSELERICREKPLSESAKKSIKSISYIIKKQMDIEKFEDPIEFLRQLCNILYCRRWVVTYYGESYNEQIDDIVRITEETFEELGYQRDMLKERANFILSKLYLYATPHYGECSTEKIINDEDVYFDSYTGLLSKEKSNNKVLIKS